MSIEFNCSQCGKLLRVGDDAAGKQARCPSCSTVQSIPAAPPASAQNPFSPTAPPPRSAPAPADSEVNPYQAPVSGSWQPIEQIHGPFQPGPLDAGDVLNRTWSIFKSEFWMITLAAFIWWVVQVAFGAISGQIVSMAVLAGGGGRPNQTALVASQLIVQTLGFLFGTWLEAGMAMYMLKTARGESAGLGDLFAASRFWPSAIVARFLYYLGWTIGFILLIIPGALVALIFSQYMYLIIERNDGPLESLSGSYAITNGNKLQILVLWLATIGVSLLGLLACCVGIFPAMGFIQLMWAVAYLAMTGQPTVDATLNQPAPFHGAPPTPELR
jgi:hypothetical protein